MPLNMTKIAYGAQDREDFLGWFDGPEEMLMTTRYLPKRHEEMVGGSLYWIYEHTLVGRSPIRRFEQRDDGRWWIVLERRLIPVFPQPRRAHQGWRYLPEDKAPRDLRDGEDVGDTLPGQLAGKLQKLGLL